MDGEEKLLEARINDLFNICERKNIVRFTSFLNEKEQYIAENIAKHRNAGYMFYGGHENAVRKIFGVFPDYMQPDEQAFPIVPVTFSYKKEYDLSHRDFLGALTALKLKREAIGDIFSAEGAAAVFLLETVANSVFSELEKVGRVGVKLTHGFDPAICTQPEFEELCGTASSARLDALTAFLTKLSREKASALIKSGNVNVNYSEATSASRILYEGDIITVRGYGKFVYCGAEGVTKKDRLRIVCKKYI